MVLRISLALVGLVGFCKLSPTPFPVTVGILIGALGSSLCALLLGRNYEVVARCQAFGFILFCVVATVVSLIWIPLYNRLMIGLGRKVKAYIEIIDRDLIGVDMHLGGVEMCLCFGRFTIKDFRVDNPPGFSKGHCISCKEVTIDFDVEATLLSRGRRIVIEEFEAKAVEVLYEYNSVLMGVGGTSNIQTIRQFMEERQDNTPTDNPRTLVLQKVAITDINAYIGSYLTGTRAQVADIRYKNYSETHKRQKIADCIYSVIWAVVNAVVLKVTSVPVVKLPG